MQGRSRAPELNFVFPPSLTRLKRHSSHRCRLKPINLRGGEIMADQIPGAEKKIVAGVLALLLGSLGIHKFYLGYNTAGIIMLLVTLLTCGFAGVIIYIIAIIEGITYLTKTDADFVATYVTGKKEWF
jgi:TM2 domain-containing membrane protein YozV